MKKLLILIITDLILILTYVFLSLSRSYLTSDIQYPISDNWWEIQSVDTMKYSRDLARQGLKDPAYQNIIASQVSEIAGVGVTHIAIDTPYDDEFLPYLEMWVTAARQHGLKIWFRGNWSGWEGWFGYSQITRADHMQKTKQFILNHPDLFADGDIFTACPECENGGPGSPRSAADITGFRQFLIDEYQITHNAFAVIRKRVNSNFFSMNADVARLVMNEYTTALTGGIVTIDHYIKDPGQYASDIMGLVQKTWGRIMLGEFGAPIPDITGSMTQDDQARWINDTLNILASQRDNLIGINYWVSVGGTTQLWDGKGHASPGVAYLHDFFEPRQKISLFVTNDFKKPLAGVPVSFIGRKYLTDGHGRVTFPFLRVSGDMNITVGDNDSGYKAVTITADPLTTIIPVIITPLKPNIFYRLGRFLTRLAL